MILRHLFGRVAIATALSAIAFTGSAVVGAAPASAEVSIPAPSPRATVSQVVGVTTISVDYASPAMRGRKIFGGLVPFGQIWRTGANAATIVAFDTEAVIGGKTIPAGRYALLTIPTAKSWTIILNSDTTLGGTRGYDEKKDVARFEVKPQKAPKRERLTFLFVDTTDDGTRLDLEWEETRISMPIQVATSALTMSSIDGHMKASWRPLANAARYLLEKNELDKALGAIDASIAVQETWFNVWVKAQVHAAKNDIKGAVATAEKAWELGNKDSYFFWKDDVEQALKAWKARL